jgi:two-component system, NtrC family, response regulator AtoC
MTARNERTILVGEDELEVRGYFEMVLRCLGYAVELAQDGDEVLSCLQASRSEISAVLLDIMMPNRDGLDTLREIRRINPTLPVIVVSGVSSATNIVTAMQNGANDFLCKPVLHEDLRKSMAKALEAKVMEYTPPSRSAMAATRAFIGSNPRMKEIHSLAAQIGWSEAPVLIQGETGSGKEVIARELHAQSPRAKKPFLKLNCAALPSELVESELFGYERGAFTGAFQKKAGMFEMADGGTILLDEIGDMEVRLQAKLLQVLQDQEFQRIGGKEPIKVDVRVMAATHRDLPQAIEDRTFREDLYYRLNVVNIFLPPLRERPEDILPMAEFLIKKHAMPDCETPPLTADLKRAMLNYDWPGNVRELENFARRLLILKHPDTLARQLQPKARKETGNPAAVTEIPAVVQQAPLERKSGPLILEEVNRAKQEAESEAILAALNSTRWNRKQAAALLNLDYKALLYKIKKLGLDGAPPSFPPHSEPRPERERALAACGD